MKYPQLDVSYKCLPLSDINWENFFFPLPPRKILPAITHELHYSSKFNMSDIVPDNDLDTNQSPFLSFERFLVHICFSYNLIQLRIHSGIIDVSCWVPAKAKPFRTLTFPPPCFTTDMSFLLPNNLTLDSSIQSTKGLANFSHALMFFVCFVLTGSVSFLQTSYKNQTSAVSIWWWKNVLYNWLLQKLPRWCDDIIGLLGTSLSILMSC